MVTPVVVTAAGRHADTSVSVRNADGKAVRGTFSADRTTVDLDRAARLRQDLLAGRGGGQRRRPATQGDQQVHHRHAAHVHAALRVPRRPAARTVGVGQPIQVRFDEAIADKAAAEKALIVTTSPPVHGAWHWFSDQVVHWRPQTYWKPGTKVTVKANVYGVHVGDEIYGQQDVTTSFTIGRSKIFTINDKTHTGVITINGKAARTVPVSMGRRRVVTVNGKTIYFTTQSGPHIVTEKYPVKRMSSASYGLPKDTPLGYDEKIPLAVRITAGRRVRALGALVGGRPGHAQRLARLRQHLPGQRALVLRQLLLRRRRRHQEHRRPLPLAAGLQRVGRPLGEVEGRQRAVS